MSDVEASVAPEVIVIGGKPKEEASNSNWFLGSEKLTEINLCFAVTTLMGLFSDLAGSTWGACGSMVIFLLYGFCFHKRVPNMERFADSLYYQGFILTLFALLWSMAGKGAHSLTSDGIIEQFGLALWTTFIGMGGRIFVVQFFTTAFDQDEQTRESIAAYVKQLNAEISSTLIELKKFREDIVSSAVITTRDLVVEAKENRKETAEAIKAALNALVKSMEVATAKLDHSVDGLASKISHLEIPEDVFSNQVRRVTEIMTADLERVRAGLEASSADFAEVLKRNVLVLSDTEADLGSLRDSLAEINRTIAESSNATSQSLESAQRSLAAAHIAEAGVGKLGATAEAMAGQLSQLAGVLEKQGQSFVGNLEDRTKLVTDALVNGAGKLADAVGQARAAHESNK